VRRVVYPEDRRGAGERPLDVRQRRVRVRTDATPRRRLPVGRQPAVRGRDGLARGDRATLGTIPPPVAGREIRDDETPPSSSRATVFFPETSIRHPGSSSTWRT